MKQSTLLAILFLFVAACKKEKPEQPATANYHSFTGDMGTNDNSTCYSNDGNLLICGNNRSDLSILKITKWGSQIWQKNFNAGIQSEASSIIELNGEIFLCGKTGKNYSSSNYDVLLVKTNASGDTIWTKTYGSTDEDYGQHIIRTSDGNILMSAITYGFGAGSFCDIYLIKVDTDGNVLWETSYANPDQEWAFHLMETQNGEYLVTGTEEDPGDSGRSLLLLKVSASGQQLWSKKIGPIWKWGFSAIETASGDLVICGQQYVPWSVTQVMLVKTDHLGNVIWEKEYGEDTKSEKSYSVKQNPDGTFTICGSVSTGNGEKIILIKADDNGNQLWFKKFNDYNGGIALNLLKDGNDNILTGNRNGGMFLTRTDGDGNYQ